jgi:hypothetical protein
VGMCGQIVYAYVQRSNRIWYMCVTSAILLVFVRGDTKVMPPIFLSENIIAVTMKFTWLLHTSQKLCFSLLSSANCCPHNASFTGLSG